MPILHREDGTQFVLQPYRELLSLTNAGLLKKELHLLAQNYGAYIHVVKQPSGHYEAVFSRDPGYLLGETVWHQLGKPNDLLYCEALENNEVLVVIVRNNSVYLDAKIPYAHLAEELASLRSGSGLFMVCIYGEVPISKTEEPGKFTLSADRVRSFAKLNSSVLEALPIRADLSLLPIDRAIAALKLNRPAQITAGVIAILVALLGLWIWWPAPPPVTSTGAVMTNPLQEYLTSLRDSDPAEQLREFAGQVVFAYGVPGWIPTKATYTRSGAQFELRSLGGPTVTLLDWAEKQRLQVKLSPQGATLNMPSRVGERLEEAEEIENSQRVLALLLDQLKQVLPNNSVQIANTVPHVSYGETGLTLTLTNVSPEVLTLIGRALRGLPVTLSTCTFTFNNGLLSGTIQLTLLGN